MNLGSIADNIEEQMLFFLFKKNLSGQRNCIRCVEEKEREEAGEQEGIRGTSSMTAGYSQKESRLTDGHGAQSFSISLHGII